MQNPLKNITIAIDGPAGAGKGTLATELARIYRMKYLDTGTLYRAVALRVMQKGGNVDSPAHALGAAEGLIKAYDFRHVGDNKFSCFLDGVDVTPKIRAKEAGDGASRVSIFPAVRKALMDFQRDFAQTWAPVYGVILDGRDIGTIICPKADFKFFLDATPDIRAQRRVQEMQQRGDTLDFDAALAQIIERDNRDRSRENAPLVAASGAHVIDTSTCNIHDVVAKVQGMIEAAMSLHTKEKAARA